MSDKSGVVLSPEQTMTVVRTLAGERFTPYTLAVKLGAKVLLESSSFHKGKERYSLLLVREAFRIIQEGDSLYMEKKGKRKRIHSGARDILGVIRYFADQHKAPAGDMPFPAGGVGFLSYEFSRYCDRIRFTERKDPLGLPDAMFLLGHVFVVFDHYTDLIHLVGVNYKEAGIDLEKALDEVEGHLNDLNFNYLSRNVKEYTAEIMDDEEIKAGFLDGVDQVRDRIIKGDLLQGVLSRRMTVKTDMPAMEAYKNLRSFNPSPYMFYLELGTSTLFGASPEMHVRVKHATATIHPIAGTRRRGGDRAEDLALEKELLADEKERAEHLMLIDLARNDLGRVAVPGSVHVPVHMNVERYSHVMHIVSKVEGTMRSDTSGVDAVRATFPAGTVSGAPKIKAIEIIDALEPHRRGFYAGLVGYMEPGGDLDTCITIRSALKQGDYMYLQAGAGIVYDSQPEREYEETKEKLMALARAIGITTI
ncbi:MAG: anthranilate synthase component I [Spirochaetales bacterium]|nr:anthranilate synthase component I [Spirochaetales bacterium]